MAKTKLTEFRPEGATNYLRVDDYVEVKLPGRKSGCIARITALTGTDSDPTYCEATLAVTCNVGIDKLDNHYGQTRVVTMDAIRARKAPDSVEKILTLIQARAA